MSTSQGPSQLSVVAILAVAGIFISQRSYPGTTGVEPLALPTQIQVTGIKPDDSPATNPTFQSSLLSPFDDYLVVANGPDLRSQPSAEEIEHCFKDDVSKVECLICTVADPLATHLGYLFDQQIETLHRALGAEGYVLHRFYLPWHQINRTKGTVKNEKPTSNWQHADPGLLVYRSTTTESGKPQTNLLGVFLVGETPTQGIQQGAFRTAVKHAAALSSSSGPPLLCISGPTFSGTAESLARAIRELRLEKAFNHANFTVINGSATAIDRKRFIGLATNGGAGELSSGHVSFNSTVAPDEFLVGGLIKYISETASGFGPLRVAWLSESGTGYGQNASTALAKSTNHVPDVKRRIELTQFQFPLNIARVRAEYEDARRREKTTTATLGPERSRLKIPFAEDSVASDLPAIQSPRMTAPSDELAIGQILTAIRTAGIEYVGISASDIRDPVFLAELIKEQAPDTQIMLVTSDLLHLHSEYQATMHGTLVASSYSLCVQDQEWCFPFGGRKTKQVLAHQSLFGLYNAISFLRGLQSGQYILDVGNDLISLNKSLGGDSALLPISYGDPLLDLQRCDNASSRFAPPIWISMIGANEIQPLAFYSQSTLRAGYSPALTLVVPTEFWNWNGDPPRPSFDPRIAPSSEFLMWFWVGMAFVYIWAVLASHERSWAKSFQFLASNDDPSLARYFWPRRMFRAMITVALLSIVTLDTSIAAIPFVIVHACHTLIDALLMLLLCLLGGVAIAGLFAVLCNDIQAFVGNDGRPVGWHIIQRLRHLVWDCQAKSLLAFHFNIPLQPDTAHHLPGWRIRTTWLYFVFAMFCELATIAYVMYSLTPSSQAKMMLFFLSWSDVWNGVSLFLPAQLLALTAILLLHGMLRQYSLVSGVTVIPKPRMFPPFDYDNCGSAKSEVVETLIYPIAARFARGKSVLLNIVVIATALAWFGSLYSRTAVTETFGGVLSFAFLAFSAYWGIRFVKAMEVCHAFERDLRRLLDAIDTRSRFSIPSWRAVVERLGPMGKFDLYEFWKCAPRWLPENLELQSALDELRKCNFDELRQSRARELSDNLFAIHVDLYVRQVLSHIAGMITGLFMTSAILFLTASSFPFNSEPLLQTTTTGMLVVLAIGMCWYYLTFDRDPLLSIINGSNPFEVTWNWSMIKTLLPTISLATIGLINQTFPEMWAWLQGVIQPLMRSAG